MAHVQIHRLTSHVTASDGSATSPGHIDRIVEEVLRRLEHGRRVADETTLHPAATAEEAPSYR
jgi:hypothetical protein